MINTKLTILVSSMFLGMTLLMGCSGSEELRAPADRTMDYLKSLDDETLKTLDTDSDGVSDYKEMKEVGTDPLSADSDDDGLNDGDEINKYDTDPNNPDTDDDGLSDGKEVNSHNTDPNKADSDGDGLSDGDEVNKHNTDPNAADSDGDGINDYDEINKYNTDPNKADSDGNGFTDGEEIEMGTDPNDANDPVYIKKGDLKTVHFSYDKSNIDDEASETLDNNIDMLMKTKKFNVRIDAYTDHVGGDQYNLRLSKRRAEAVTDYYKDNGFSGSRIESRGLGKAPQPCMDQTDEKGCRKNRRAESHPLSQFKYQPSN